MIDKNNVLRLHQLALEKYGGSFGLRDEGALESALARPFQTFGGKDLYDSLFKKVAAICESIILNHPFVDGNKRTAFLAMLMILKQENMELSADENEIYSFLVSIASGKRNFETIEEWLKENTVFINK